MGCFDTIIYTCPKCGKQAESQTKLAERLCDTFEIGKKIKMPDGVFVFKTPCHCGEYSAMIVISEVIVHIVPAKSIVAEECGGQYKKLYNPRRIQHDYSRAMKRLGIRAFSPAEATEEMNKP